MAEYITKEGMKKLRERLNYLKEVERPAIMKRVVAAREMGDLSENAEYHAAREQQRQCDTEMDKINKRLTKLKVIDTDKLSKDAVRFGDYVKVKNLETDKNIYYRLVGVDEVDFDHDDENYTYISVKSPIGKAMVGKKENEEFVVKAPIGDKKYKILNIK